MTKERALFAWSGGKDCALALRKIQTSGQYEISAILTTVTRDYERVSMHGVREALLRQQADMLGYPLSVVSIPKSASNEQYEESMRSALEEHKRAGVSVVVFGDIFLEWIRDYRRKNLEKVGLAGVFPLWGSDTTVLSKEFVAEGFGAVVTCVDTKQLNKSFCGRELNQSFFSDLPKGVDPCGENGEFHSFVFKGPVFRNKIEFELGEKVLRGKQFYFCDLLPSSEKV